MDIPAGFAAQSAILRQNVALSVIKQNAEAQKQLVNILDQSLNSPLLNSSRGSVVNIRA